jgi:hypothetical protein
VHPPHSEDISIERPTEESDLGTAAKSGGRSFEGCRASGTLAGHVSQISRPGLEPGTAAKSGGLRHGEPVGFCYIMGANVLIGLSKNKLREHRVVLESTSPGLQPGAGTVSATDPFETQRKKPDVAVTPGFEKCLIRHWAECHSRKGYTGSVFAGWQANCRVCLPSDMRIDRKKLIEVVLNPVPWLHAGIVASRISRTDQ